MIGYGPENQGKCLKFHLQINFTWLLLIIDFALELTYNYGIDSYAFGNDLLYIAIHQPSALLRAAKLGYEVVDNIIRGCDSYNYKILPWLAGRAEHFAAIALRVADLAKAKDYWIGVLGLQEYPPVVGLESPFPTCFVGFGEGQTLLQLVQVEDGQPVDHALSSGRIAFACASVNPIFQSVSSSPLDKVLVPPLTLPTPGKADVVVTILQDRDGYEICFVEDLAFYQLAEPKYDVVDFAFRASRGGDGNPLPKAAKLPPIEGVAEVADWETLQSKLRDREGVAILCFGAAWCKKCQQLQPFLQAQALARLGKATFVKVDIDEAEELADLFLVKQVPRLIISSSSSLAEADQRVAKDVVLADYVGSDESAIAALVEQHCG
jgi:thiol-disulfide isomerase/thioredoxin